MKPACTQGHGNGAIVVSVPGHGSDVGGFVKVRCKSRRRLQEVAMLCVCVVNQILILTTCRELSTICSQPPRPGVSPLKSTSSAVSARSRRHQAARVHANLEHEEGLDERLVPHAQIRLAHRRKMSTGCISSSTSKHEATGCISPFGNAERCLRRLLSALSAAV